MAKERLTLYDRYGNVIEYDISSASVTIDAEGKSLDIKLSEIATALLQAVTSVTFNGKPYNRENGKINIGEQMQVDWNESSASYPTFIKNKPNVVTGVKMGANGAVNTPSNGVVTLPEPGSQATLDNAMSSESENGVQNKVIKAYVDNLINGLINGAPAALDTLNELSAALGNDSNFAATITNALAAKANSSDIYTKAEVDDKVANAGKVKSVSVNGGAPAQPDAQGNVNINVQAGGLTKDDISVETQGDGTVDINVKDDTYKINLNHTHEGMAKLVKCTEATLPDELADDTIYVQVDDASNPTEIESLYLFGLEFTGGSSAPGVPTLTSPSNGSAINVGTNTGTGVTKTLRVKGRNLTQALTVSISGTGFSVDVNSISAVDANAGVDIEITYNGIVANASGTLTISSSEVSVQCDVAAAYENPYEAMGVQFDKAVNNSVAGDGITTATGYCISPVLSVTRSHAYKVCFGFKGSGSTATYGIGVYDNNNARLAVFTADSTDSDGVREFTLTYAATTAICTFLSNKIDDCYFYDKTDGTYLFKGVNVQ